MGRLPENLLPASSDDEGPKGKGEVREDLNAGGVADPKGFEVEISRIRRWFGLPTIYQEL
jgi:hypothetical protein